MNTFSPIVSIVIPAYNIEEYLGKCITSILNQSYKNIQILIINDGSKDQTLKIAQQYSKQDSRIEIIDKQNEGVSIARNIGISLAKGEFIMFVDGDDWIEHNMVEQLLNIIISEKADYVGGGFIFEDSNSKRKRYSPSNFLKFSIEGNKILSSYLSGHRIWSSVWGCIIRTKLLQDYRLHFQENLKYDEDCYFIMQLMSKAQKVVVIPDHFYHVTVRTSSVTRKSFHELTDKERPDYIGYLKENRCWSTIKYDYYAWNIRSCNHELFHLALRVSLKTYITFYRTFTVKMNYKKWNTFKIRKRMNTKHRIMSFVGLFPIITWCVLNTPRLFGKQILI